MNDVKKDNKDYLLGLHWASTTGNVGLVKFALDHGAPIDAVVNGFMPLQLACISDNNIAVVQYLIDRGADVNAQRWSKKHSTDKSQAVAGAIGSTALHVACANGCVRIVDLLLRNDASVHLKDKYGSRPIDIALAKHHTEIVKLLETFGALQEQNEAIEASQQRQQNVRKRPSIMSAAGRRSMDVWDQRAERMRRPSLPSVFERRANNASAKENTTHPLQTAILATDTPMETSNNDGTSSTAPLSSTPENAEKDLVAPSSSPIPPVPPLVASSNASDDTLAASSTSSSSRKSSAYWLHDGQYLSSLERRAYNLDERMPRMSFDTSASSAPISTRPTLKRCSSDGGHLRATARAHHQRYARNNAPLNRVIDDSENENTVIQPYSSSVPPPLPPLSLLANSTTALEREFSAVEERDMKKAWWSAFGGRKSMDVSLLQHHHLDFRPSFDQSAGRPMIPPPPKRPGFFSRWTSTWSLRKA